MDGDFLEAVKRHILSRLQMRGRPNITHAVPKAAMVTALRKLHAGKVREDGRVEIPHLDGHASPGADGQERVSEIISFAETGGSGPPAVCRGPRSLPLSLSLPAPAAAAAAAAAAARAPWGQPGLQAGLLRPWPCALCPGCSPFPPGRRPPSWCLNPPPPSAWPSTPALRNRAPAPLGARPPPGRCARPWLCGHLVGDCLMFLFPTIGV